MPTAHDNNVAHVLPTLTDVILSSAGYSSRSKEIVVLGHIQGKSL